MSGGLSGRGSQILLHNAGCDWQTDGFKGEAAVDTLLGTRCSLPWIPNATSCNNIFTAQTPIGERVSS